VHTVRFRLSGAQRDAFHDPGIAVKLTVDHPAYGEGTPLTGPPAAR